MSLQKQFDKFNKTIRMDYEVNSELAEKRDILIGKLRGNADLTGFKEFNQGSYAMFTGVTPMDKDYDIDVGLRFNINSCDCDVIKLKNQIADILDSHTEYGAEVKNSCVTVKYKKGGEIAFHVDLVPYSYDDKDSDERKLLLAYGKNTVTKEWKYSNPLELRDAILNNFDDTDEREQFRRIIRYLKRWKNIVFSQSGEAEPPSIGITVLAYNNFTPHNYDFLTSEYVFDDLDALINVVNKIKDEFKFSSFDEKGKMLYKIETFVIGMEEIEENNIFRKMTEKQMTAFKEKNSELYDGLVKVRDEPDIVRQCELLKAIFGDDFEVPVKKEESKQQHNYVPSSAESGN